VHEAIKLLFGVVSGVGRGMGVLDGPFMCFKGKGKFWRGFFLTGLNGVFDCICKTNMYSTRA